MEQQGAPLKHRRAANTTEEGGLAEHQQEPVKLKKKDNDMTKKDTKLK